MSYVIALDLKGHLVELSGSFPTHQAVLEYLHKEHYDEIDQGQGLKEIGSTYLVNIDLLPLPLKNDGELVELAIEKWFNSMDNSVPKPIWLI